VTGGRNKGGILVREKCENLGSMGDLQDPKMEVLYHIRPYFWGISPYIALT